MRTELVKNIANEGIYQLQYYKNLYLALKKIKKIRLVVFFNKNSLFDSISRLLLFKILINLLIEFFYKLHPSPNKLFLRYLLKLCVIYHF